MEPIISPWVFYMVSVAADAKLVIGIVAPIFLAASILSTIAVLDDDNNLADRYPIKYRRTVDRTRWFIVITVILGLIFILIPTEDTIYKMMAAQLTTPDNIAAAENNIVEFVTKLAEALANHNK